VHPWYASSRDPEGLAAALSIAMARISAHTIPVVADLTERIARTHSDLPATTAGHGKH
jgi:hypothetical protein